MKIVFCFWVGLTCLFFSASAQNNKSEMDLFINDLMSKMTLEEKIGQLNLLSIGFDVTGPILSQDVEDKIRKGLVGGVFNSYSPNTIKKLQDIVIKETRLKIPLIFGYDIIHGHKTIFPIPLGLAASWDINLIERTARASAVEASADGLNWTFSPMVDITRDPRWGRVSEGAGEDPYLGSQIGKAMVKGYQGDSLSKNNTILACLKHFALYGAPEGGRDYNTVDMSRIRMYNEYLPPYKAVVDAGVGSVMTSFNEIDGIPASGNKWLLTDLLRKQWGFKGLVVTDYTAIMEMVNHGVGDKAEVSAMSINAGTDMDMVSEYFINELLGLVKEGKVTEDRINAACRLILEAKYKLGLFDDPYRYISDERATKEIMSTEKKALAKEAALKSIVLLKNNNKVLPLNASKKIAILGPLVKDKRNLIGNWSGAGDWKKATSIWEALGKILDTTKISYALGCNLIDDSELRTKLNQHDGQIGIDKMSPKQLIKQALSVTKNADIIVTVLGESFGMTGEAASRSEIGLPENQLNLLKALKKTGKPTVLILMNGRPMTLSWEDENMDAILETWYGGTMAGDAIVDILFGKYNPSGKITMTFPRVLGQIPIYYNFKNTGRPFKDKEKYTTKYLDAPNEPLYPFGYGLSYSNFTYSDVSLSKNRMKAGETITVSVTVTNNDDHDGEEVVQLYIRDLIGSITRPIKELKGFQKIFLKKGESKTITFNITEEDLKFYNNDLKFVAEPGDFRIFIGGNSRDVKEADFALTK